MAVAAVLGAALLRVTVFHGLGEQSPFITFYPAVVLASLYGGAPAGLLATLLSTLASFFWLRDPPGFHLPLSADVPRLLLFILVALLIVWLGHRAYRAGQQATRALSERERSEQRIGEMLDSLAEAFVLIDKDWRFVYVNRICETMFGMPRAEMLGKTLWQCFPTAVGSESERQFRHAMDTRSSVHFELLSQRLNRWISLGAFPLAGGLSVHVEDIDDRKRAEQALRESEERYRRLVETAQEGIWMMDAETKTSYVNRAMAEMLGYTPAEMLGRPVYDFMDDAARPEALAHTERCKQGQSQRHDFRFRRKDGSDFYAYVSTNPIISETGEYLGALAMVSDVSARRKAEAERGELLLREQKARADAESANRRKDQFLAVLSHELRTPLTPVLARLALMKREVNLSNTFKSGLEMIRRNVELEARLIDDLLDMTRLARGQLKLHPEVIDAHEKMLAALEIYDAEITARKQTVSIELNAREHFVLADGVRVQQVFWNLIGNAVKYTPERGRITIRSTNESEGGPGKLRVQVIDNGIGIDPEVMPRLFDPFEQGEQTLTRRYGGLGLGLSISRTLIQMQGGTVTAESDGKGLGATFTVDLPTIPAPAPTPPPEMKPEPPSPAQLISAEAAVQRILLVDDNEDTLRVMARLLRLNGHHVTTAESVTAALAAATEPFDLLITDIGLPDGTGWELMRELRRRGPVRGIALSGFSMDEDIRRSRDVGFIEHLCKPIMPDDLEEAIRRAGKTK
jgi:PAS domain S-box-containing protein